MEYISREEFERAFKLKVKNPNKDYQRGMQDAIDCLIPEVLSKMPAADVQPVKHSRWIPMNDGTYNAYCENCGHERGSKAWNKADYKYCPNCGARMDGDTE